MKHSIMFDPTNEVASFAAAEWQRYVGALTGRARPDRRASGGQRVVIAIQGDAMFARLPGPVRRLARKIRYDGFAAGVYRGTVYIVSVQPRGALFGVYDLLERDGGIVFAAPGPGGEYVSRRPAFAVRTTLAVQNPRMPIRVVASHNAIEPLPAQILLDLADWLAKRKFSGLGRFNVEVYEAVSESLDPEIRRRGLNLNIGGHSALSLLPSERYMASHPEFFAVDDNGQRCAKNLCYSNRSMRKEMARRAVEFFSRHPAVTELDLWPPDGAAACRCDVCRTRSSGYWTYQTTVFVANRIRRAHPTVRIVHLAYDLYTQPPPACGACPTT